MNKEILDEAIDVVSSYVGTIDDWITVKKELLKSMSPVNRMYFSTRDPVTKKQCINDFEKIVIERWFQKTGTRLIFKEHDKKR